MSTAAGRLGAFLVPLVALTLAALAAVRAGAEQTGRAGLVVSFDAQVTPNVLPRHALAPISISLSGSVRADNGKTPPRLGRLELAFGARGGLDSAGLPTCPRSRLRNATARQALDRCRDALVGRGSILTEVPLAPERPLLARARALAFNARTRRGPAVWVHAYLESPPVSFVLPFTLRQLRHRAYGVLLTSSVARALGRWPRLRSFRITIGRRYRSRGKLRSYLNGRCALPPRFHSLSVPLARAAYRFAPAPTIVTTILRACRVRE